MSYNYGPVVHALSVEGNLSTEGARLLIDCEEALHKLGFVTKLQLSITREKPEEIVSPEAPTS